MSLRLNWHISRAENLQYDDDDDDDEDDMKLELMCPFVVSQPTGLQAANRD